jgi:hypothetical protein
MSNAPETIRIEERSELEVAELKKHGPVLRLD